MQTHNLAFAAGFPDPVLDAQATFRATMNALARPGRCEPLLRAVAAPLPSGLAALALTLLDSDTAVWLDEGLGANQAVRDWLAFQTGAPVMDDPQVADFALVADPKSLLPLDRFSLGSDEYPDHSTTLIVALPQLIGGPMLSLEGPGIESRIIFAPQDLPPGFIAAWQANREQFPRGVDLLLSDGKAVAGLLRTTRITGGA